MIAAAHVLVDLMFLRLLAAALLAFAVVAGAAAAPAAAGGDADRGKVDFNRYCSACHDVEAGQNKIGPSLFGVVGRPAATGPGYSYSAAMKNVHKVWTPDALNTYLEHPQQVVPGTKMVYPGVRDEKQRHDVIAYLETLK